MTRRAMAIGLAVLALGWALALVAAPLVRPETTGPVAARMAALTYVVGGLVCHQRPERSFHLAGAQLPVCARCAALYWGGAAGAIGWLAAARRRRDRQWFARALVIAGVPVLITVAAAVSGLWDPVNWLRAALSAPLGVVVGTVLSAVTLEDLR